LNTYSNQPLLAKQINNMTNRNFSALNAAEQVFYPAYLDLFAVVFAPPLIWAIVKRRGLLTWASAIIYLTVSIVDHAGNLVTTTFVGPPSIAELIQFGVFITLRWLLA